jgi:hypothetical protein
MKPTSANGVKGILIRTLDGTYKFRVCDAEQNFIDYDLTHSDLCVIITDPDAFFYRGDNIDRLDHSPATLGIFGITE